MALNPAFASPSTRKLPLAFGYVKVQGDPLLQTVGLDGSQYTLYLLGEGEWDGIEMANSYAVGGTPNGSLQASGAHLWSPPVRNGDVLNPINPAAAQTSMASYLRFHAGTYTPIGTEIPVVDPATGLIPHNSSQDPGPSQGYDPWFAQFPSVTPPQSFSGIAYAIWRAPGPAEAYQDWLNWPPPQGPQSYGSWFNSIYQPPTVSGTAVWRSTKCRMFDAYGNVTGYGFTLNPAWHKVEAILRYKIRPQQPPVGGLTDAEKACFNWESIAELAARNDYILPNGNPRFVGNYIFAADATLANMMETMCRIDRSYQLIDNGKICLIGDDDRASVFIASAKHLVPGTLKLDKKDVSKAPNLFVPQYRDLDIPAVCEVQSGVSYGGFTLSGRYNLGFRALTCSTPSPFAAGSYMRYGGCSDPSWDGTYAVVIVDGDPYPVGTNFPNNTYALMSTPAGTPIENVTGGYLGADDARFAERAPTGVQHRSAQRMVAQQAIGLSVQPRINRVNYDCGNSTFDQTNRLMKFERDSQLGTDTGAGWTAPIAGTLSLYYESVDANGAQLPLKLAPRQVITLDSWLFPENPGDYQVMEMSIRPAKAGQLAQVDLTLMQFNHDAYTDVSDPPDNQYTVVPNSSLKLSGFTPSTFGGYVLNATLGLTDVGGTLTISIPDLLIQILGQTAPTSLPTFQVTGVPPNTPITLYVNYPLGLGGAPTFNWVAGNAIYGTYVIPVARGTFSL